MNIEQSRSFDNQKYESKERENIERKFNRYTLNGCSERMHS